MAARATAAAPEERLINGACVDLPAEAPGVVTVSALGRVRLKSYYSSYGQGVVDVSAPGGDTRQPNPAVSTTANAILSTTINTTTRVNGWGTCRARRWPARTPLASRLSPFPPTRACHRARWPLCWSAPRSLPCPPGVYDPRPGLDQFKAECRGGSRNSFYGAGEINAFNAVK